MTILLSNEEIAELLTPEAVLAALEEAYAEYAEGRAILGARANLVSPSGRDDAVHQFKIMGSIVPSLGVSALRLNSDILSWPVVNGKKRRKKLPLAPGDRWTGLVLLFSTTTSEPLAMFPDGEMQRLRVGAASALGTKYMSRPDSKVAALIGAGFQAGAHVRTLAAVRDLDEIRLYSPRPESREAFAKEMAPVIGVEIKPVDSVEAAVDGADIVQCATNSLENVIFPGMIKPGMHVGSIRDGELALDVIRSAKHVALHDPDGVDPPQTYATHGIETPDQKRQANDPSMDYLRKAPILADLITNRAPGRSSPDDITCFLNLRGLAIQFAAVGAVINRLAREQGVGRELPTEWFTEDVHP